MKYVLCDCQHRFWPKQSCESQLITTINDLAKCLNEKGQRDVLVLDFRKVFDKVPHVCLFKKLHHYGICNTLLLWLKSFLTNRSQYIALDNQKSHPSVIRGPSRYISSSIVLFTLYQWPPFSSTFKSEVVCWQCDNIKSKADCQLLQEDLDALVQWVHTWQMGVQPPKMRFFKNNKQKESFGFWLLYTIGSYQTSLPYKISWCDNNQ